MIWLINISVNDGYPYLAGVETPQPLNKSNIFKEPLPYYLWRIRERRTMGLQPVLHGRLEHGSKLRPPVQVGMGLLKLSR